MKRRCLLCCLCFLLMTLISSSSAVPRYFDCRREDTTCSGGGTCDHNTGLCACTNRAIDYKCFLDPTKYQKLMPSACSLHCSVHSTCVKNVATQTEMCYCTEQYYGEKCDQKRVDVRCESTHMIVKLRPISQPAGGIYVSGHRHTNACRAKAVGAGLAYELTLDYNKGCGAAISGDTQIENSPNPGDVTNQNYIVIQYSSLFESSLDKIYTVRCFIAADKTVNVHGSVGNADNGNGNGNGNGDNGYPVTTTASPTYTGLLFEVLDDRTGNKITGPIPMGRILQLKFSLKDTTVYSTFRVVTCVAEAWPKPSNPQSTTLVEAGCTVTRKPGSLMIVEGFTTDPTSSPPYAIFKVKAFKFSRGKTVNFQCTVDLCKRGETSCRISTCAKGMGIGRKKRSLENQAVRFETNINIGSETNLHDLGR